MNIPLSVGLKREHELSSLLVERFLALDWHMLRVRHILSRLLNSSTRLARSIDDLGCTLSSICLLCMCYLCGFSGLGRSVSSSLGCLHASRNVLCLSVRICVVVGQHRLGRCCCSIRTRLHRCR